MAKKIKNTKKGASHQKLTIVDGSLAYSQLRERVAKEGIFKRSYGYYALLTAFVFSGFFFSMYQLVVTQVSAIFFLWAIIFSFFAVQIAGLLHDSGHKAVFASNKWNDFFGNFCGAFVAEGYNYWKKKHNMHHAHPNQDGADPDIELPLLSFTKEDYRSKKGVAKFIQRYQAYLYYPLGLLVVFSPRIGSVKYLINEFKPKVWWEIIIFTLSFFAWFILPFLVFDLQKALLLFTIVNVAVGLYLLNVFAPNHKGMPKLEKGVKISFMEHQILTSRNINGHWLTDFIYMGLNYQIEHHLFPNTPRNKLKLITPFVRELCRRKNIEYTTVSAIETNQIILSELNQIAKTA